MSETNEDFGLIEYKEAANAYFRGVDIGFATLKSYFTFNTLLAAVVGYAFGSSASTKLAASPFVALAPVFGIVASLVFLASLGHYYRHLENCRMRCEEIEKARGGALFTRLGRIARPDKPSFSTMLGLLSIMLLFIAAWFLVSLSLGTWQIIYDFLVGILR